MFSTPPKKVNIINTLNIKDYNDNKNKLKSVEADLNCLSLNFSSQNKDETWQSLYKQIISNNLPKLEELLSSGIDPNVSNSSGETLVYLCVDIENYEALQILMKYKADCNIQKNNGCTPLHLAINKNKKKLILLLLENKANPNIRNNYNYQTALHLAVINKIEDEKILRKIKQNEADLYEKKDKFGKSPFDYAKEIGDQKYIDLLVNIFGNEIIYRNISNESGNKNFYNNDDDKNNNKNDGNNNLNIDHYENFSALKLSSSGSSPIKNENTNFINDIKKGSIYKENSSMNNSQNSNNSIYSNNSNNNFVDRIKKENKENISNNMSDKNIIINKTDSFLNMKGNDLLKNIIVITAKRINDQANKNKMIHYQRIFNTQLPPVEDEKENKPPIQNNKINQTSINIISTTINRFRNIDTLSSKEENNSITRNINNLTNNNITNSSFNINNYIKPEAINNNPLLTSTSHVFSELQSESKDNNDNYNNDINNNNQTPNINKSNDISIKDAFNYSSNNNYNNINSSFPSKNSFSLNNSLKYSKSFSNLNQNEKNYTNNPPSLHYNHSFDNYLAQETKQYKKFSKSLNKTQNIPSIDNLKEKINNLKMQNNWTTIESTRNSLLNNINIFNTEIEKQKTETNINNTNCNNKDSLSFISNINYTNTKEEIVTTTNKIDDVDLNKNIIFYNTNSNYSNITFKEITHKNNNNDNSSNNKNNNSIMNNRNHFYGTSFPSSFSSWSTSLNKQTKKSLKSLKANESSISNNNNNNNTYITNANNTNNYISEDISTTNVFTHHQQNESIKIFTNQSQTQSLSQTQSQNQSKILMATPRNISNDLLFRLREWLISCDLLCYYNIFIQNNLYNIDELIMKIKNNEISINFRDVEDLGIKKPGHIFRFLLKIQIEANILDSNFCNSIIDKFNLNALSTIGLTSSASEVKCCGITLYRKTRSDNESNNNNINNLKYCDIFEFLQYKNLMKFKENFIHNGFDQIEYILIQLFSEYKFNMEILTEYLHIYSDEDKKFVIHKLYEEKKVISEEYGIPFDSNEEKDIISKYKEEEEDPDNSNNNSNYNSNDYNTNKSCSIF